MWSYRLVETIENDETFISIAEVYFNEKKEPYGWTHAEVFGESVEECKRVLEMMENAFLYPVVKQGDFVEDME